MQYSAVFTDILTDGKPSGNIVDLGRYNNDYEWPEEEHASSPSSSSSSPYKPRYHSQYYLNGTECDLTGNMRKTEVKVTDVFW